MKKRQLIIYGTSVIAALANEYFTHDTEYNVAAFVVEEKYWSCKEFCGRPVHTFESCKKIFPPESFDMFVAIGSLQLNFVREKICSCARELGYILASYISSSAQVWSNVSFGDNCFILPLSIIQPFVVIGNGVFIWDGSNVGHHSKIADYAFVASAGISGLCSIGRHSFLGGGSLISEGITIADDNFITLGAVVHKDTKYNSVYRGDPAKRNIVDAHTFCGVLGADDALA